MLFNEYKNEMAGDDAFATDTVTSLSPGGENGDWDDEEDEGFDDESADLDDLHEIQVDDDIGEPDPEDDDHLRRMMTDGKML